MNEFLLKRPCFNCPFRTDIPAYLSVRRVQDLEHSMVVRGEAFHCHKTTVDGDEDDEGAVAKVAGEGSQHCAGGMILLMKIGQPGQLMRIAHRLGLFDPTKLDMDAPVYDSFDQMEQAQDDYRGPKR